MSDLCLKISPKLSRTRLVNNNVLSLRLAVEYWREVCGASRRSGPAFAGGGRSAVAGRGPCLLLLLLLLLPDLLPASATEENLTHPANHPFLTGADVFYLLLSYFVSFMFIRAIYSITGFVTFCVFYVFYSDPYDLTSILVLLHILHIVSNIFILHLTPANQSNFRLE